MAPRPAAPHIVRFPVDEPITAPATVQAAPPAAHVITRRAVWSWWVYDLANTIFSMGIVSMYFSKYIRDHVGADRADALYGNVSAVSMAIIFVISPLLGGMTDRAPRRMPFLIWSTVLCVGLTAALGSVGFWPTMLCFIVANAAYSAGLQFYDAMLPDVSTEENRGRIGGIGVGIGYLGSYIAVTLGFVFGTDNLQLLFVAIAAVFLTLSIPCFLFVKERGNAHPRPVFSWAATVESTRITIQTLREGEKYPGLLRFLIGRIFYTDAINTVISIMFLYTLNVADANGLTPKQGSAAGMSIMMVAITFAVLGGFMWGRIVDRIGPKTTLNWVLRLWVVTFISAAAIGLLTLPLWVLYIVASMAGVGMGGVWSADRPLMLRLTPPDRIGEFYGLYGMVGRFSAITGPFIWALVARATIESGWLKPAQGQGVGVIVLMGFILLSYGILRRVTDEKRDWSHLGANS
ncbi:MAG: MFS transporter [Gemmatimonadetes bacterium]|nr:MFS transporter [Gemmatimonadota bacterium]